MILRHLFTENFLWKVLSFLLAMLIWFAIHSILPQGRRDPSLGPLPPGPLAPPSLANIGEIEIKGIPLAILRHQGRADAYTTSPSLVNVAVKGDAATLTLLTAQDILAYVELTDLATEPGAAGNGREIARMVKVRTPDGVALVSVTPPAVIVKLVSPTAPHTRNAEIP